MPDDLRWSWCNNRNKVHKKYNALESCPNPNSQSMEKTVLHQTGPWCQKVWGPLIKTLTMHDSFNPHDLCDGSFRHDSQEPPHPDIHTLYNPLPWVWAWQGDFTPVVENTRKWCDVTSEVRLQRIHESDAMSPLRLGYKQLGHLSGWYSFFSCPLTWSLWWTRLAFCELLTQRFM